MRLHERISTTPRWSPKSDRLVELAQMREGSTRETNEVSVSGGGSSLLARTPNRWRHDSPLVQEYVSLAETDGFRPTSVEQGRQILIRYESFLRDRLETSLEGAGWKDYAAYRTYLARSQISRATLGCYLRYLTSFYRLRAQASQAREHLDDYMRVRALGAGRPASSGKWSPMTRRLVQRLLKAAEGEDYLFLMTLLYTGGRAQFYGLRVDELDHERGEITTIVKAGRTVTLPLHPELSRLLKQHLVTRDYDSAFLFRNGRDLSTRLGQKSNRQNAWRICKRAQRAAGIQESVHPHRFRKTLAASMRRAGLDPLFSQAILAHTRLRTTLDEYAHVGLEELKRHFARVDPLHSGAAREERLEKAKGLLARLQRLGPEGKEQAWGLLLEGLEGLISG